MRPSFRDRKLFLQARTALSQFILDACFGLCIHPLLSLGINHKKMTSPFLQLILRYSFALFLGLFSSLAQTETFTALVVGISDGDTLTVLDAVNRQHKIRLVGIDAPEKKQAFGTAFKAEFVQPYIWQERNY